MGTSHIPYIPGGFVPGSFLSCLVEEYAQKIIRPPDYAGAFECISILEVGMETPTEIMGSIWYQVYVKECEAAMNAQISIAREMKKEELKWSTPKNPKSIPPKANRISRMEFINRNIPRRR